MFAPQPISRSFRPGGGDRRRPSIRSGGSAGAAASIVALQRQAGNAAVSRLIGRPPQVQRRIAERLAADLAHVTVKGPGSLAASLSLGRGAYKPLIDIPTDVEGVHLHAHLNAVDPPEAADLSGWTLKYVAGPSEGTYYYNAEARSVGPLSDADRALFDKHLDRWRSKAGYPTSIVWASESRDARGAKRAAALAAAASQREAEKQRIREAFVAAAALAGWLDSQPPPKHGRQEFELSLASVPTRRKKETLGPWKTRCIADLRGRAGLGEVALELRSPGTSSVPLLVDYPDYSAYAAAHGGVETALAAIQTKPPTDHWGDWGRALERRITNAQLVDIPWIDAIPWIAARIARLG
jgi:hypothetical protein